jgi:hypothetical protein
MLPRQFDALLGFWHGAAGRLTGLSDSTGTGIGQGIIVAAKYTKFGIARMELIACETHDGSWAWKRKRLATRDRPDDEG